MRELRPSPRQPTSDAVEFAPHGLNYNDVQPVFLPLIQGRKAFEEGLIDAWAIWEPYRTAAEMSVGARTVTDGTGLVSNNDCFFVTKTFAAESPQLIDRVLRATRDVFAQAAKDIPGTAKTFGAATEFPVSVLEATLSRRGFDVQPMSKQVIDEQQRIADIFKRIALIPANIVVADALYKPGAPHNRRCRSALVNEDQMLSGSAKRLSVRP